MNKSSLKKLTFMLIPDTTGVARQISVPVSLLWAGLTLTIVLLFGSFFLAAQYFADQVSQEELDRLGQENDELAAK